MIVEITGITQTTDSPTQAEYRVLMKIDGAERSFSFSAIRTPVQGIDWETQFTEEVMRHHRRIAHQIMTIVDLFHDGKTVALPQCFKD